MYVPTQCLACNSPGMVALVPQICISSRTLSAHLAWLCQLGPCPFRFSSDSTGFVAHPAGSHVLLPFGHIYTSFVILTILFSALLFYQTSSSPLPEGFSPSPGQTFMPFCIPSHFIHNSSGNVVVCWYRPIDPYPDSPC